MINRTFIIAFTIVLTGCGSYNSIDSFYEAHKNDDQITAIRVPQTMLTLLSGLSPDMKALIGNTRDLRYMQFPSATADRTRFLNNQMNTITGNSFVEVYRRNDELKRNIISIRETRSAVKEILIYNNNSINGSFLYFNGNFNPAKVRELANGEKFEELSKGLLQQYDVSNSPGINNE